MHILLHNPDPSAARARTLCLPQQCVSSLQASRDEVHDHHSILALIQNGVHGVSSKLLISAFKLGICFGFASYKNGLVIILQVPVLPPNMHWDEADLEPIRVFLSEAAGAGHYVPCPGLSWSTKPIM